MWKGFQFSLCIIKAITCIFQKGNKQTQKKKESQQIPLVFSFSTNLTAFLHSTYFPYVCPEMTNELLEFNDHTNRNNSASYILSSLFLGARVIISSTLHIISAASVAESNTACLTLNDSEIPSFSRPPTYERTKTKVRKWNQP